MNNYWHLLQKSISILFVSLFLFSCAGNINNKKLSAGISQDIVPAYVPRGYALISDFTIKEGDVSTVVNTVGEDEKSICTDDLYSAFSTIRTPAGNDLTGIYYQKNHKLIIITKSLFPGGTLDLWREIHQESYEENCSCGCDGTFEISVGVPIIFQNVNFFEKRDIAGTDVAILQVQNGWITVFMKGDYWVAMESALSLENHIKVTESILQTDVSLQILKYDRGELQKNFLV